MSTNDRFPRFGVRNFIFAALLLLSMSRGSLSAATRVWTGLSTNDLWLTSGNWTSSILPTSSDDVVFPTTGAQRSNVNDLLASLHSIIFGDGGYTIVGNTVTLTNGILATNTSVAENLWAPLLVLGANQSFSNLNGGATLLISQLDLHGRSLRLGGAGTNIIGNVLEDSAGGGSFTNAGTGVFLFSVPSGGSTFSGPMTLSSGTNLFTGFQLLGPISWTAGTLGGTGHLGNVTASGVTAKTLTPEYLDSPGTLSTSNLVLTSAVTLAMQIRGTNAGVDYDQISANGNVTLGSATLSLSFLTNLSPIVGTTLTLIKVANGSTLTGTFAGLPEGSTFTNNRAIYQLSYIGGSGHDVTLSVSGLNSTGTSLTWSGAGTNNLWMNRSNWSGNIAPQQGDELVFQDMGGFFPLPQATNFNDFPADTTFDSLHIALEAGRTNINVKWLGNSLRLNNGVHLEAVAFNALTATGVHSVSNHITLNASQTFSNSLDGVLHLAGGVDLGSNTLSVGVRQGTSIFFDAPVTGPGVFEADGDGTVILNASNAVTGSMSVNRGFVLAEHPQALGSAASGPVHVSTNGTLELFLSNTVFTASSLVLTGSLQAPLTNITLSSAITTAGSNATIVVGTSGSLAVTGLLTNNTLLTNSGGGLLYVPPGSVVQGGGQLRDLSRMDVDGSVHNVVAVGSFLLSGFLSGSGQIDSLICTNTSSVAPGSVSDSSLAYSPLRVGNLLASSNRVAFSINLFPNRPGGGATNTQIIVTNAPTLGDSTLKVFAQATLSPNQQFTIVRNLSAAPITNTFLNLPEGAFFAATNGNLGIQISYVGGAGDDVVLTVQSNTPPVFPTPTNSVTVNELATLIYTNVIQDLEPSDTNYTWTNLTPVAGMVLNPTNGVLTWTPQEGQACSNYTILMQVTDSGTPPMSATGVLNILVQEINRRPVPVPVPLTNMLAGHTLTIPLNATDADLPPQPLTWSMVTNPAPASASVSTIDPFAGTGQFTYSPDVTATNFGTNIFVVKVTDSDPCDTNFPSLSSNLTITVVLTPNRFVTNTNNSGPGSLRQAILDISSNSIGGHIEFAITNPATGPFKIAPTNALPVLGANTFIDGYTQPGAHPNTKTNGTDAVILIELSGENIPGQPMLQSGFNGVTLRGLCINRVTNTLFAVNLDSCCGLPSSCGASGDSVEGCFIGTDTSGSFALPNTGMGVHFGCIYNARLGGPDPAQRNLISGNLGDGVDVRNQLSSLLIQNNLIGTDHTGTNALPNGSHGISFPLGPVSGVTIADNVISANAQYGVFIDGTTGAVLVRNKIGIGSDGLTPLGNAVGGVLLQGNGNVDNFVGSGTNAADANTIADNNGFGVEVASGSANSVLGNSIFRNTGRAIHLESGANSNQAAPVLTSATAGVGTLTVNGTLTSLSNRTYRLEFFHNPDFNPNNQPQAWNFLGFTNVTTAANSNASFSITFQQSLSGGFITATATDTNGSTSAISDGQSMSLPVPLQFSSISRSGTNLIFSGAGGTSNGTYHMLASTNITLPITNWTALLTSQFDPDGNFIFSNTFDPAVPQRFYRLATP